MSASEEKLAAVRQSMSLGAHVVERVNSRRGWTKTADREFRRDLRRILTVVLERKPTAEELEAVAAWGE